MGKTRDVKIIIAGRDPFVVTCNDGDTPKTLFERANIPFDPSSQTVKAGKATLSANKPLDGLITRISVAGKPANG